MNLSINLWKAGEYDFEGRLPWLDLSKDSHSNDISKEELDKIVQKYQAEILKEQQNRASVQL